LIDGNAMTLSALYETDIVAWADRQVAELRRLEEAGITNAVDWANVIEEIESVGGASGGPSRQDDPKSRARHPLRSAARPSRTVPVHPG
jgi:hypothetical protein